MAGSGKLTTFRCIDCKKIKRGSEKARWCDDCGGELRRITYGSRRRVKRGR